MTRKDLEAKVANAQGTVEKRKNVLAKHRAQLEKLIAKGADSYDIRWKEDDIKGAVKKLEEAKRILAGWEEKLGSHISREAFIEANAPQVIKDFLENWKASAIEYYTERRATYIQKYKEIRQQEREARRDFHECYRRRGTNIIDIELTGADAPVTKELERDALEKIKCYVNKLRADKAAAQIRVRELEAEVTRLKAKLYDMTTN